MMCATRLAGPLSLEHPNALRGGPVLLARHSAAFRPARVISCPARRLLSTRIRAEQQQAQQEKGQEDGAPLAHASEPLAGAEGSDGSTHKDQQQPEEPLPELELVYDEPDSTHKAWTSFKLAFALPWRRFKSGSALVAKLGGAISEQPQPRFGGSGYSMPAICEALRKAAYDPRVSGVVLKIEPLAVGWAKLQELRRHIEFFRQSGKFTVAYMDRAGEKEYYLASACEEVYAPPGAYLSLRGLSVSGTFLRGVLDKVGVEPQVKRLGKYKSAGDQLLRTDMSDAQREQLTALLDDIYATWVADVARSRGKTAEEVEAMLNEGIFDMRQYKEGGWVTDLIYEDQLEELLKKRTGGKEDEVAKVALKKYQRVNPSAFGLVGKKAIGVLRASGAITAGSGGRGSSGITSGDIIKQLRALKKDKKVAAVVLRVDSPGGDALASDLMWREIRQLAAEKPVIASMADVAASGGYYMSMAASKIVAEPLTITGSIGVVTGKLNLQELYQRVGYGKETISRGRFAELLAENRPFKPEEEALFDASAQHAYESFRDKAAESRGMSVEDMQAVAQGRVWSGTAAAGAGLVDHIGGMSRAVQLAKQAAGIPQKEAVRLLEVSRAGRSPLQLLAGGATAAGGPAGGALRWAATLGLLLQGLLQGGGSAAGAPAVSASAAVGAPLLMELAAAAALAQGSSGAGAAEMEAAAALASNLAAGQALALMPSVAVDGAGSVAAAGSSGDAAALGSAGSGSEGGLFADC